MAIRDPLRCHINFRLGTCHFSTENVYRQAWWHKPIIQELGGSSNRIMTSSPARDLTVEENVVEYNIYVT